MIGPIGNSHYDGLQTSVEHRFSSGYQVKVAYTLSKATGIAGASGRLVWLLYLAAMGGARFGKG